MNSVFFDPGWIAFIETKHQLTHKVLVAGTEGNDTAFAKMLVFVNSKGKLRTPRLMAFSPVHFHTTKTTSLSKLQRQWLTLGGELAEQMNELGYGGALSLDPTVEDVRPWQWKGIEATIRYTMHIPLPALQQNFSSSVRKNIKKAQRSGYTVEKSDDIVAVTDCLTATEQRQSFGYGLTAGDINFLVRNMEPGAFRVYLARDADGNPASSRIVLAGKDGMAIDLVAGTHSDHLRNGVTQLIIDRTLEDLAEYGVKMFDYGGANIESVAASKMEWGVELVPFFTLSSLGPRSLALQGKRWINKAIREVRR